MIEKLASGEISVGLVVDFFVRAAKKEGSPVDYTVPKEGAMLVPTPVAIIKGSGNLEAARAFVNYLYTPDAQRLFASRAYIPILPDVPLPSGAVDTAGIKIIQPNLGYIEQNREEIKRRFAALFGSP